jgi:drug/metabolite transporter (DMT)-like permease
MPWILFAFSGPIFWAASTHIDKYLIERYFKEGSVSVLMVFTSIIGVIALPIIWLFVPGVTAIPLQSMLVIAASGIFYMGALYFYLQALQSEEASVVSPFFQAAAIFGFILGFLFLGEQPSPIQLFGGAMIIAGSAILSIRFGGSGRRIKRRLVLLMLASSFVLALSSLIFKFFAVEDAFWSTTFWSFIGEALFGAVLMIPSANRRHFVAMLRSNTVPVLTINGINEVINLAGGLGSRYALLFAPLGIVQAISGTTLFFVLLFGVLLSLFFPKLGREEIGGKSLIKKTVAIAFVVAGVWLVNR